MAETDVVKNYLNTIDVDTPIFIETIKNLVGNNAKLILSRLVCNGLITRYDRGIYYKSEPTIWGPSTIASDDVLLYKYLQDKDGNIKGYITGARLFNYMGLTTQVPRMTEIVSNEHSNKNKIVKYNAVIQRARIPVNNENYFYQQIIDVIENKGNDYIEIDMPEKRIRRFFNENELDFDTLYKIGLERKMGQRNLKKMINCIKRA